MVEISLSGSGEGPGWVTGRGYSTGGTRDGGWLPECGEENLPGL